MALLRAARCRSDIELGHEVLKSSPVAMTSKRLCGCCARHHGTSRSPAARRTSSQFARYNARLCAGRVLGNAVGYTPRLLSG
jgi:hypothetical protein